MILVTGASGRIGRRVAEILAGHKLEVRAMTRTPNRMPRIPGCSSVAGDYSDPGSLDEAFSGIERAFIVSAYGEPGKRALLHKNAITAAARAGVQYLVYLSFQGASPDSRFPLGRDHFQTETYLHESGVPFVALRDNLYMDDIPALFDEEGVAKGPAGDGKAAWVSREDVAQTVAAALMHPPHGEAYDVTGPERLSLADAAGKLSALTGRTFRYENESREDGRRWRAALGAPDWEVEIWLGSYEAIAAGELERPSSTVREFVGRDPNAFDEYFALHPELLER